MNGQLNGFHEAFIEEGTFLFTSESVGKVTQVSGRGTREDGAVALGIEAVRLGENSGGRAPPSCSSRRLQCAAAAPLPFLSSPSGGAPRHAEGSRKREGRGPATGAGRALFPPL